MLPEIHPLPPLTTNGWYPAIATVSLGPAHLHFITVKIDTAAQNGQQVLGLFHDDFAQYANALRGQARAASPDRSDCGFEIDAAHAIRGLCAQHGLTILALRPFRHYEDH